MKITYYVPSIRMGVIKKTENAVSVDGDVEKVGHLRIASGNT